MLLVMTISSLWSISASPTASVVVPILMNSDELLDFRELPRLGMDFYRVRLS
jgi:hypothetical protein